MTCRVARARDTGGGLLVVRRWWLATACALLLLVVGGCSGGAQGDDLPQVKGYVSVPGAPLGPASEALTQVDGSRWTFSSPTPGRLTLLYFGYTSCPDVCPTTMADLASALTRLPTAVRDKVWVQFVSTDPHRDTPRQIGAWLDGFDPTFHGARGPIATVIRAARVYGVGIEAPKVTRHDYQVTHGAQLFVLDQHGAAVGYFEQLAGSRTYAQLLPTLVQRYA